jgi:hypothetical protein
MLSVDVVDKPELNPEKDSQAIVVADQLVQ